MLHFLNGQYVIVIDLMYQHLLSTKLCGSAFSAYANEERDLQSYRTLDYCLIRTRVVCT